MQLCQGAVALQAELMCSAAPAPPWLQAALHPSAPGLGVGLTLSSLQWEAVSLAQVWPFLQQVLSCPWLEGVDVALKAV